MRDGSAPDRASLRRSPPVQWQPCRSCHPWRTWLLRAQLMLLLILSQLG